MRVAFCIYDYVPENLPLQPWLTVCQVASYLSAQGHEVHVITDAAGAQGTGDLPVHVVSSLRGSNSAEVRGVLQGINPECVVVLITPLNLATTAWFDLLKECRGIAFASYAFYSAGQIMTALRHVEARMLYSYARHLLVPARLWRKTLTTCFKAIICQSETTSDHLSGLVKGCLPVYAIQPGIDKHVWHTRNEAASGEGGGFLYVGRASHIRGFYVALDAMAYISEKGVRLKVLARGAATDAIARIDEEIKRRGLEEHVEIVGGWLSREQIVTEFHRATAVLLPFVLVPSELPVSAMEAIACGVPVIATDIDGLPSTIGDAGIIVRQGKVRALAEAMQQLHADRQKLAECRVAARRKTTDMTSWDTMGRHWEKVLLGE